MPTHTPSLPNDQETAKWEADEVRFVDISRIIPGLYLGNIVASYHVPKLQEHNISAIVSLVESRHPRWATPKFQSQIPSSESDSDTHQSQHLVIPAFDSDTQDLLMHFQKICDFIDAQMNAEQNVLVHCIAGVSRSPTAVTAYLMRKWGKGVDKTLAYVAGKRREARPSESFLEQLRVWEEVGCDIWEEGEEGGMMMPKRAYREYLERRAGVESPGGKRRGRRVVVVK
ncbi:protein-tyrosine phosphatase-like protein [Immersiella caudata]|uniref:Protein-tyrosine phosphatase-like protein n=1 Tax=Immersiella caudata TaxID=314043 RepID=A0AA39WFR5_9PEZI|nr:protein-tyrosine phosphatase-like protein [Immersiella caudata]